jgi:hypothetical protein
VGVERMKSTVAVAVGEGVSVLTVGVSVGLGVNEGMAAAVCVPAALTVCAIKVLTAPGSTVGTDGAASVGTHAMISARAVTQTNNLVLRVAVIISSSTSEHNQDIDSFLFFNDDRRIWIAQTAFHNERHDIGTFLSRGDRIKVNGKLLIRL